MLAYRHHFHAGNFADVFKHALLVRLLAAVAAKDKPFFCLDTHAGIGRYDLSHAWAQKNAEFRDGIGRLWGRSDLPVLLAPYMESVRAENPDGKLRFYPGSPLIARRFLRPGDRMVLSELNRTDVAELGALFARDRQVTVHLIDGYHALKAQLPPAERRGLVLVDSSFDRAGELRRVADALALAHERWATGIYAIWYPLMELPAMRGFERDVVATGIRKILQLELSVRPEGWTQTLRGCGMLVVNPPYRFDEEAEAIVAWLADVLAMGGGGRVRWLVPE
ncbi:MAG TPA: 23S rRNA (adenine(2030)-N(6))-methyltransferase RlmJ [Burkholderiales bacterium]|nr:23S rRNA (adenine(2030)-N(6))-methyltransferase RlmJ [Burkholderiales bacterium]